MENDNLEYWKRRAVAERRMAENASDPEVARIHAAMAETYEQMSAAEPRRRLSIRAG